MINAEEKEALANKVEIINKAMDQIDKIDKTLKFLEDYNESPLEFTVHAYTTVEDDSFKNIYDIDDIDEFKAMFIEYLENRYLVLSAFLNTLLPEDPIE